MKSFIIVEGWRQKQQRLNCTVRLTLTLSDADVIVKPYLLQSSLLGNTICHTVWTWKDSPQHIRGILSQLEPTSHWWCHTAVVLACEWCRAAGRCLGENTSCNDWRTARAVGVRCDFLVHRKWLPWFWPLSSPWSASPETPEPLLSGICRPNHDRHRNSDTWCLHYFVCNNILVKFSLHLLKNLPVTL